MYAFVREGLEKQMPICILLWRFLRPACGKAQNDKALEFITVVYSANVHDPVIASEAWQSPHFKLYEHLVCLQQAYQNHK